MLTSHSDPWPPEDVGVAQQLHSVPVDGDDDGPTSKEPPVGEAEITDGAFLGGGDTWRGWDVGGGGTLWGHPTPSPPRGPTCQQHQVGIAEGIAAVVAQEEGAVGGQKPPCCPTEVAWDAQGFQRGPERPQKRTD